jgi:hypothetical protein
MIATHWVVGDKHYCMACWPRFRRYYEEGAGRDVYYAPR